MLTIEQQIAAMADDWPALTVVDRGDGRAVWRGPLKPVLQTFIVEIAYRVPSILELTDLRRVQPLVRVVSPRLRPRRGDPEGQLPHVYYIGDGPLDVVLCMFDPKSDEWLPSLTVAESTVPFTIDWLHSYEGWRATGRWTGGGRHVEATATNG